MRAYSAKTEFFKDKYKLPAIKKVKNLSKYTAILERGPLDHLRSVQQEWLFYQLDLYR